MGNKKVRKIFYVIGRSVAVSYIMEAREVSEVVLTHHGEQAIPVMRETMRLSSLVLSAAFDIKALSHAVPKDVLCEMALNARDVLEKVEEIVLICCVRITCYPEE
jgi:hypothetical protein